MNLKFAHLKSADDMMKLEVLARQHASEGHFETYEFDPLAFREAAVKAEESPSTQGVLAAFQGERPIGVVYVTMNQFLVLKGASICTCQWFFIDKNIRTSLIAGKVAVGLITGLRTWAQNRQAEEIFFYVLGNQSQAASAHTFLKKCGARTLGGAYVMQAKRL